MGASCYFGVYLSMFLCSTPTVASLKGIHCGAESLWLRLHQWSWISKGNSYFVGTWRDNHLAGRWYSQTSPIFFMFDGPGLPFLSSVLGVGKSPFPHVPTKSEKHVEPLGGIWECADDQVLLVWYTMYTHTYYCIYLSITIFIYSYFLFTINMESKYTFRHTVSSPFQRASSTIWSNSNPDMKNTQRNLNCFKLKWFWDTNHQKDILIKNFSVVICYETKKNTVSTGVIKLPILGEWKNT